MNDTSTLDNATVIELNPQKNGSLQLSCQVTPNITLVVESKIIILENQEVMDIRKITVNMVFHLDYRLTELWENIEWLQGVFTEFTKESCTIYPYKGTRRKGSYVKITTTLTTGYLDTQELKKLYAVFQRTINSRTNKLILRGLEIKKNKTPRSSNERLSA